MSYSIYDGETTVKNQKSLSEYVIGTMKASPYHPDNYIVIEGWIENGRTSITTDTHNRVPATNLLVGQNIKFDLLYMLRYKPAILQWIKDGGAIWCTMLAEYLLTGQQSKFASLDKLSMKYGGELKDDRIKEFWDAGLDTTDIPPDMLEEYLIGDITNTEIVYLAQRKLAEEKGMLPLIESQMEALLGTTIMEYNGMAFDKQIAGEAIRELQEEHDAVLEEVVSEMTEREPVFHTFTWNPLSNQQLSAYLFGGTVKYTTDLPVMEDGEPVRYKGGKKKGEIKTKKHEIEVGIKGLHKDVEARGAKDIHPIGDDVLNKLPSSPLIDRVKRLRDLTKQIKTYFIGYSKLVWQDGRIHGSFNHTQTETGRLSSSKPNMQNVKK